MKQGRAIRVQEPLENNRSKNVQNRERRSERTIICAFKSNQTHKQLQIFV